MVGNLHEWVATRAASSRAATSWTPSRMARVASTAPAHAPAYHDYSTGFRCCADGGQRRACPRLTIESRPDPSGRSPQRLRVRPRPREFCVGARALLPWGRPVRFGTAVAGGNAKHTKREFSMSPSTNEGPGTSGDVSRARFRAALRYVRRHPFRAIAACTVAGALLDAELAVALGVVASVAVLLAAPSGAEARRDLRRRLRLGRGAVTETRERPPRSAAVLPGQPSRERVG
jgi:hypothetical protein